MLDASGLVGDDDVYKRNPAFLRLFDLALEDSFDPTNVQHHDVSSATFDVNAGELRVTVFPAAGKSLAEFIAGGSSLVTLTPFYLKLETAGSQLEYPEDSEITVTFEGAFADAEGNPDEGTTSGTLSDITDLNAEEYDFFRFQVHFDLSTSGASVDQETPRPGIEFLRVPFRLLTP